MVSSSSSSSSTPSFWWESITDECPLTLDRICSLPYPPFLLGTHMYFDGLALASYIVSQGNFSNPLTREALTREDCRRLDEHVATYHNVSSVSLVEAYGLRQLVSVNQSSSSGYNAEQQARRATALRNEAAAALCGLFVYNREQRGRRRIDPREEQQSVPRFGFALSNASVQETHIQGTEGYRVVDDDEGMAVASHQQALNEVQTAFPKLSTKEALSDVRQDESFLKLVRATADNLRRDEKKQRDRMERYRQLHQKEMEETKAARKQALEERKQQAAEQRQLEAANMEEVKLARLEIAKWRDQQWDRMLAMSEAKRQRERTEKEEEKRNKKEQAVVDLQRAQEERDATETLAAKVKEEADKAAIDKRKATAAAKRKRARERKQAQKAQERLELQQRQNAEDRQARQAASEQKCSQCGIGMLDAGFEKCGQRFCTTKCARSYKP